MALSVLAATSPARSHDDQPASKYTYRVPVPPGGPVEMGPEDRCNVAAVTPAEFSMYAAAMVHGERFALGDGERWTIAEGGVQ
jgi:hypothetical protein